MRALFEPASGVEPGPRRRIRRAAPIWWPRAGDISKAAICSKRSAELYGLKILAENINSNTNNTTRFVVVSPKMELREGRDKVSTCFCIPHQSGSLHEILTIFAVHGLNMVRLESRPIQGRSWEYMFFLEFTGDVTAEGMEGVFRGADPVGGAGPCAG